ncbi:MAG TPA: TolC family protein [Ignavibacteriaceae bacterium]|nr:TolC family protein [Ignavibacteriaceae bacterium]
MKKLFLIIILITSVNCFSQQSDKEILKLNDAISLTLKNYPLLKKAVKNVDVFNAKIKQQESFDYPVVNAEATYTRIGPIPSIGLPGTGSFELAPVNNYDAHIAAYYNLYDFGKKDAELDLVKSYKKTAEDNIDFVKSELTFAAIRTFYSILFLEKSIAVNETDIETLKEHIDITNRKIESGTATDYDLLSTKVRLADYKSNKVTLQNQLNNQIILLKHLTGLSKNQGFNLSGDFSLLTTKINLDSLIQVAFNQRQELTIAMDKENSAHLKKNITSMADRPNVNLQVSYGLKNGFEPNLDAIRGNWSAGIGVSIPIFNGFRTDAQVEEAKANLNVSEINTMEIKERINSEVQKAVDNINSNLEQIKTAELKINLAEQALEKAKAQYASGVGTNLDLLDAETHLADAKFLYLKETYNNIIHSYELKKAVGDITW